MLSENQLKNYTMWSNFIYFIAGIFSALIGITSFRKIGRTDSMIFILFGIIIILTGAFSIHYHYNTPSWNDDPNIIKENRFKDSLNIDKGFSITSIVYAILFLFYRVALKGPNQIIIDPVLWLTLLFSILSIVFYCLSHSSFNHAVKECNKDTQCFNEHIDEYDIFHSNWHIFTSITALFWITLLKHTYD